MWCGIFIVMLIFLETVCGEYHDRPRVRTEFGVYRGIWTETLRRNNVASFLGIPYAKPPIGNLRFKKPEPLTKPWRRIKDSTKFASPCFSDGVSRVGSEDCLYLNVFTPQVDQYEIRTKNETNRAVLVFLISGLFVPNDNALYHPYYLLSQDIVLVTVNYRSGLFGFFTTGDEAAPGNYGLKDVLEALKWIKKNIKAFGGDPESVTLMGHGTGAGIAHLLALSEKSEGLFHRYVTQSGVAQAGWSYRPRNMVKTMSLEFASSINCNQSTSQEIMECMHQNVPVTITERELDMIPRSWLEYGPTDEPESDEAVITEHPKTLIKNGKMRDIPWLTGVVADEGVMMSQELLLNTSMCNDLSKRFEPIVHRLVNYRDNIIDLSAFVQDLAWFYFDGNLTEDCADSFVEMVGDILVTWPLYETMTSQASQMNSNVYFYNFAYQGTFTIGYTFDDTQRFGVCHGDEVNYLFPVLNDLFDDWLLINMEDDKAVINIVTEMWANFVKTGVPSAKWTTDWEPYQKEQGYMEFGHKANLTMKNNFLNDRMVFWHNITEKYYRQDLAEPPEGQSDGSSASVHMKNVNILKKLYSLLALILIPAILAR